MKIIDYRFGQLQTEYQTFDKDVVLSESQIYSNWWRKEGHKLYWEDIARFIEETDPEMLVVGQGKYGRMSIDQEVKNKLNELGIEFYAAKSDHAVEEFNKQIDQKRVLGAFHLTC